MLTYSPTSPIGSRPYVTRVKPLPTSYKRNNNRRPQKDQTPLICITLFSLRGLKSLLILVIVSEFEKRDNFAQNAMFYHFSTYHHFKAVRALGFRLGLLAVWTFYSTVPSGEPPKRGIKWQFLITIDAGAAPPTPEVGGAR